MSDIAKPSVVIQRISTRKRSVPEKLRDLPPDDLNQKQSITSPYKKKAAERLRSSEKKTNVLNPYQKTAPSRSNFPGAFHSGCIASPNATVGQHTMGTTTFFELRQKKVEVHKKIAIARKRICALNTQYGNLMRSCKKAEGDLNELVRP